MEEQRDQGNHRWSIILAGGEGQHMKPFIQTWLGYAKPKQYCAFSGTRSMLQHTWDRADHIGSPDRKVTVIDHAHRRELFQQLALSQSGRVIAQPRNCDTAAGVFLALTYARAADPDATVVIFPSDHFVAPQWRFVEKVKRAIWAAERLAERVVVLGAPANSVEREYGWIYPGRTLGWSAGSPVRAIDHFFETPDQAKSLAAMKAGALWNTLILAAKAATLWALGRHCFPALMARFDQLGEAIGSVTEARTLEAIYQGMPVRNVSTHLLERTPECLAVLELEDIVWSDWGRPTRIVETLRLIGKEPAFPLECLAAPALPSRARDIGKFMAEHP